MGVTGIAEASPPHLRSLRRAAWISDEVLLLAFDPDGEAQASAGSPAAGGRCLEVEARIFAAPFGTIVAAAPSDGLEGARRLKLVGTREAGAPTVEVEAIRRVLTDMRTFLREGPAGWDAATRTALLDFLARLGAEYGLSASLSEGLGRVREALRERRPVSVSDRRAGRGIAIERLHRIDAHSFYIRGRAWDEVAPVTKLAATSPEGERVELLDRVFRHPSLGAGFIGLFRTAAPSRGEDGWVIDAASCPGQAVEVSASLTADPLNTIFADADLEFDGADALREEHVRPAVARLNELCCAGVDVVELASHGHAPVSPAVSLLVPLQRRIDLIEHQLAQFAADPELEECELIYVLCEPDQSEALEELAAELFALYGRPFRVVALTEAAGMPIACNLGAQLARADRLVFLDADVLPDCAGWIGAMAAALNADPEAAAATPKLLFADEAIEQAGLEYCRADDGAELSLRYRLRGMHRSVPAATASEAVAAAGMACLMIEAAEFHRAGDLRGEYGLGTYEGSDLSRRLAADGRNLRYVPEAELYRLEGLGSAPEAMAERYARWLHSRLWQEREIAGALR